MQILILVLVLTTLLSTSVTSTEILPRENGDSCGSVLTESSGLLRYKPLKSANFGERCVWILRAPAATGYNVTLYNIGYLGKNEKNALHIAGVQHLEHKLNSIFPSELDTNYSIDGSVAVLTYYSGSYDSGRGFSLFWSAHQSNSNDTATVSPDSVTNIVSTTSENISHPLLTSGLEKYDNNELSTFVFSPEFSTFDKDKYESRIRFVQFGLQGITCKDYIDIFVFYVDLPNTGWKTYGRICGSDTDVTFSANDMVLLVFQSDGNQNGLGFELAYINKCFKYYC